MCRQRSGAPGCLSKRVPRGCSPRRRVRPCCPCPGKRRGGLLLLCYPQKSSVVAPRSRLLSHQLAYGRRETPEPADRQLTTTLVATPRPLLTSFALRRPTSNWNHSRDTDASFFQPAATNPFL